MIAPTYSNPLNFAAAVTADFVQSVAPTKSATLLDVGCGDGLIAAQLVNAGYRVFAIDGNEESVKKAREIGVNAKHCLLKDYENNPFDVIFVSRALHHMPPLIENLKKIDSLLAPDGLLVIEDFGFELVDSSAAAWLIKQTKLVKDNREIEGGRHQWLVSSCNLPPNEALERWLHHHWEKHHLFTSKEMKEALTNQFQSASCQPNAYLFCYICDLLPATADGAEQARAIWQEESDLLAEEKLPASGFRMILQKL